MVDIENLWLKYGNSEVLKGINLRVKKGEYILLKGVSGSGKTSLLSIIGAMQKPTSGKVLIDNQPFYKLPDLHLSNFRLNHISFVFQEFNLIESLNVWQNILTPLIPTKVSKKEASRKIEKALNLANISHKKDATIGSLSGGEKQRVAIARALVNDAPLLLCDEPTANLDRANSIEFIKLTQKLNQEGKTIIVATHDNIFEERENFRVVNMLDGKIVDSNK